MGFLRRLLGTPKDQTEDISGYGSLLLPPSAEAGALLSAMTREEKSNFLSILRHLQEWHESVAEQAPLCFHPEARASYWGTALAKVADHYRETGINDKALFFMSAAWNTSKYPVFAYNAAILSSESGDHKHARALLETYLAEYQQVPKNTSLMLVNPNMTIEELEEMATSARERLTCYVTG